MRAACLLVFGLAACIAACTGSSDNDAGNSDASRADVPVDVVPESSAPDIQDGPVCADADGDGHRDSACGGNDCDDSDPNRFPGNPEVCDSAQHDEDCNPNTVGTTDDDHDSFVSSACCNGTTMGAPRCGPDCDDSNASVHPGQAEVCNHIDDNCDGVIDEGLTQTFYIDADSDLFGSATGTPIVACVAPSGFVTDHADCDDTTASTHPGAPDVCNGRDDDCDGMIDNGTALCPVGHTCSAGVCH